MSHLQQCCIQVASNIVVSDIGVDQCRIQANSDIVVYNIFVAYKPFSDIVVYEPPQILMCTSRSCRCCLGANSTTVMYDPRLTLLCMMSLKSYQISCSGWMTAMALQLVANFHLRVVSMKYQQLY